MIISPPTPSSFNKTIRHVTATFNGSTSVAVPISPPITTDIIVIPTMSSTNINYKFSIVNYAADFIYLSLGTSGVVGTLDLIVIERTASSNPIINYLSEQVDERINGKTPSVAWPLFNEDGTRNTNCWAANVDTTCITYYGDPGDGSHDTFCIGGALITPSIVQFVAHCHPSVGFAIKFVTNTNEIVSGTITNLVTLSGDICLALLDAPMPSSITPALYLPSNWATYLPELLRQPPIVRIGGLCLNQYKQVHVGDLNFVNGSDLVYFAAPIDPTRLSFYIDAITGDSGSPACIIINGQLVLVTLWTTGGNGSGTMLSNYIDVINTAISGMGCSDVVTSCNLAGLTP